MKKHCAALLVIVMLAACAFQAALAENGDVIIEDTKAYYDALFNHYAGDIPRATSVLVDEYGPFITRIIVRNKTVYVMTKALKRDADKVRYVTRLKAGTTVYQQPSFFASAQELEEDAKVYVVAMKGDWVMVRGGMRGIYAYVPVMDIEGARLVR